MLYKGKSIFGFGISKSRNRLSYQDVSKCYLQLYDQVNDLHMINANVYVDTCTLLSESGLDLLKAFQSLFSSTNHKLLITSAVLLELEKVGNRDPNKAEKVSAILDYMGYMEANNTLYIVYTPTSFNDSALVSRFVIELQNNNIILITNDIALADTASCLSEFLNQHCAINTNGHTVTAYKLCNSELIIIKKKERNDLYVQQLQKQQLFSVTPRFHFAG